MMENKYELLYLFIDGIEGIIAKNQGINFSNNYNIIFDINQPNEIIIQEKRNPFKNLLSAKNINNISLIVGINGAGKTSILNLLATIRKERKQKYLYNIKYFAVYRVGSKFMIEGFGENILAGIFKESKNSSWIDEEYGVLCDYVAEERKFIQAGSSQDIINKVGYFYYVDKINNNFMDSKVNEEEDISFTFERKIINKPDYGSIYKYIKEYKNIVQNQNTTNLQNKFDHSIKKVSDLNHIKFVVRVNSNIKIEKRYCDSRDSIQYNFVRVMLATIDHNFYSDHDDSDRNLRQEYSEYKMNMLNKFRFNETINMNNINAIIQFIESLDNNYFERENEKSDYGDLFVKQQKVYGELYIDINDKYSVKIENLLRELTFLVTNNVISINMTSISAGEAKLIDVFASLYTEAYNTKNKYESCIVILDEPNKGLHPEMERRFIYSLVNFTDELCRVMKCSFQYILATHSPFLISDIPKSNVICLNCDSGETIIQTSQSGLLSNISDIMKNTFFMNAPIGMYAEEIFLEIENQISLIQSLEDPKIKYVEEIISDIDEPTLKMYLRESLDKKSTELMDDNAMLIEYYQKAIDNLKRKRND